MLVVEKVTVLKSVGLKWVVRGDTTNMKDLYRETQMLVYGNITQTLMVPK